MSLTNQTRPSRRRLPPPVPWWRTWRGLVVGLVAVLAAGVVALSLGWRPGPGAVTGATPWATLGTRDVHSLAFDAADPQHLYFGHHEGLLETRNGGRTWAPTALTGVDAMNVRPASASVLQIAGHDLFIETADGGRTWRNVPSDLPGLDLHAFAVDPADPAHEWAYSVGFGLFESSDRGRHWEQRQGGDWPALAAADLSGTSWLIGLSAAGLSSSTDGGRTWHTLSGPSGQLLSLAAAPDASLIVAGTSSGIYVSSDRGATWQSTGFKRPAVTVAVAPSDPRSIAVVDDETRFYRSRDGGATWPGPS